MSIGICVKNNSLASANLSSRVGLGFLFIYHGLVPKIIYLSAVEIQLVELSGVGIRAEILSPLAGILEIVLGLSIVFLRNSLYPIYLAAGSLVLLLLFTALFMPSILIEAFNPVSTNSLGLVLCYIIVISQSTSKY